MKYESMLKQGRRNTYSLWCKILNRSCTVKFEIITPVTDSVNGGYWHSAPCSAPEWDIRRNSSRTSCARRRTKQLHATMPWYCSIITFMTRIKTQWTLNNNRGFTRFNNRWTWSASTHRLDWVRWKLFFLSNCRRKLFEVRITVDGMVNNEH